ncbi:MAG: OmpA family protein [Prevotella sp.]|jgi:outer membrane protein OmpA-like peptidoglycan-associated protein|nr:OmpA family protein [Prevotella sp.]
MKKTNFVAYLMCALMVMGCSTNAGTGSLLGAGGGAALGGIIGNIIGKNTKSTVIGAAIGTAVGTTAGALIGKHMDKVKAKAAAVENAQVTEITDQNGLTAVKVAFDSGILFATGKYALNNASKTALTKFAEMLKAEPQLLIDIQGHTDSTGSDKVNNPLSQNRAQAVANYLVNCGVPASQFQNVSGFGSTQPIADNSTAAGRQQNRRVEIFMYASQAMIDAANAGTLQ